MHAAATGDLRVPLATVEATSTLRWTSSDDDGRLEAIDEDLYFAELLRRGELRNRRCAADLRLFLEVCRRPPARTSEEWADAVGDALPWTAVPGASPLDIEPTDSDGGEELVFAAVVLAALVALSAAIAPLLLGPPQGPPDVAAYYATGSLE